MTKPKHGLGRLQWPDPRDKQFLLAPPSPSKPRVNRTWFDNGYWGNQGSTSRCVGFAWAHFLENAPVTHREPGPYVDPATIYANAQLVDEWAGTPHEGTSVRAGAKALQAAGYITEYRWAYDVDTIARQVLEAGPVVMGTDWHQGMFTPDARGVVVPDGPIAGGHAYLVNGYSKKSGMFRCKQSWGRSWGVEGRFYIHQDDLAALLYRDGEAAMATEP